MLESRAPVTVESSLTRHECSFKRPRFLGRSDAEAELLAEIRGLRARVEELAERA
jgi:hypothetical protein